ncbi:unnamed protein product [Candidula unifasciata]|uniref:G-protein coupled receptors family 1 profile domain-containing protein n=1 Tax=Candidula unifasciata TaxID=100452 RepID=A0A8S3YMS4_9EUPU|nr:unnamed protein product [Candidula unifasciata]
MGVDDLIFVIIISLTLSVTVIFNIVLLVVILITPKMLTPTNILICNLAVSDIFLSGMVTSQNVHDISHASLDYFEGDFSCRLVNFSPLVCVMASIYSMVAVSFERKQAIVVTQHRKTTMTQAVLVVPIIWLLSLIFCIPTIHEYTQYVEDTGNGTLIIRCGSHGVSRTFSIINGIGILLLAYIVPLVILVVNYGSIVLFFRSRRLIGDVTESNGLTTRALFEIRINVVKMLTLMSALFTVSWLPYFVLLIIEELATRLTPTAQLRISLSVLSTTYNFGLNVFYNRNLRTVLKAMVMCQKVSTKKNTVFIANHRRQSQASPACEVIRSKKVLDFKHGYI